MRKLNICTWKSCKAIKSNLGLSIAFALSAVWSFGAVLILLINFRYAEGTKTLGLNEIGDYLAGVFSPLAFGWLIYGYIIQNKELKLSRDTQELQLKEYIKSVNKFEKQTSALVEQNILLEQKESHVRKSKNSIFIQPSISTIISGDPISYTRLRKNSSLKE
ncbi:hypothetical protein MAQ5080_03345 [Marinomonas aquimarina]|uniref:Uncharacterized protein n=1 Tax=Marinomonas aquimarina TaxID=295068 RepID=A0A1A8TSQ6_9GAMM|nr:hypothetical protein [Marinomonas aquimarina]SBS36057.1 hypothetical protein MAQ5080_03345 [Marinomonas aquimarina]